MGKKCFEHLLVSPDKTDKLAIPELCVLVGEDESVFQAVHTRYFTCEKPICPACLSANTRVSKVIRRKLKDILRSPSKEPKIIDLVFAQRYYRCNACKNRVFPEAIEFAERGCRYTNRLSDILADGTLSASYEKVCKSYGVPASKASVGVIMRRRLKYRQSLLPTLKTPQTLGVFEVQYFGNYCPIIIGMTDDEVYFIDILEDSSEDTYLRFFRSLDFKQVKCVYIDPVEQLNAATHTAFQNTPIVISDECILRYIRDSFTEVIEKDGKRCGIAHKYDVLCKPEAYQSDYESKCVRIGLSTRPRLRAAYHAYQDLLQRVETQWKPELITDWVDDLSTYLNDEIESQRAKHPEEELQALDPFSEFDIVADAVRLYGDNIEAYHALPNKAPASYASSIQGIVAAIKRMPHCIYDVLRARMLLNIKPETATEGDKQYRIGIRIDLLTERMNKITDKIIKERENDGYESEDSAGWDQ